MRDCRLCKGTGFVAGPPIKDESGRVYDSQIPCNHQYPVALPKPQKPPKSPIQADPDHTRRTEIRSAAIELGRRGGLKGGKARAESLSQEERSRIARKAAQSRWGQSQGPVQ